ncbi:hypothetical protein BKG71_18715 [Mycobacteroides chelonae]|nr:hypothetical protein BKG63_24205 [Mycobacteroides chelonae]OHT99574.1 hypothetical protein BKG72_03875 [Mycobacteroides chelonae]OHU01234.1 hypothetical protein BKG71_18715 [Mycobacteroides chelonae]OLT92893.1 hypothetical protein BKG59_05505 [Mycobacteroides chelonae]
MLLEQVKGTLETIQAYAKQITSGNNFQRVLELDPAEDELDYYQKIAAWCDEELPGTGGKYRELVVGFKGDDWSDIEVELANAIEEDSTNAKLEQDGIYVEFDEPTVDETPINEYPLEVVDERGKEFAVVISAGGPHVEVVANGGSTPRLAGYWGGEKVTLHDSEALETFMDYFIERG